MKFYRLYAGDDGRSHFEALDASKASEFFNGTRPAMGLLFRNDFARTSSIFTARPGAAG